MRYGEFMLIANNISQNTIDQIKRLANPETLPKHRLSYVAGKIADVWKRLRRFFSLRIDTKKDLNEITIGEYFLLLNAKDGIIEVAFDVLYGYSKAQVMRLSVEQVFGVVNMVTEELARISKLFENAQIAPTQEEAKAGVKNAAGNCGLSLIDYISKRQRISLDEAEKMKWQTVYALMILDKNAEEYRRRLQAAYTKKVKK